MIEKVGEKLENRLKELLEAYFSSKDEEIKKALREKIDICQKTLALGLFENEDESGK